MVEGFETAFLRTKAQALSVKDLEKLASIALIEGILKVSFPKSFPPGDSQNHSPTLRAGGRSLLTAS
jgi:hypothetical protein